MTRWTLIGLAAAAGLAAVARLGAWMQRRGWVNFRGGSPGGGAGALGAFQQVVEPQSRHVYQMRQEKPPAGPDAGAP
jgi:hypothetical protein